MKFNAEADAYDFEFEALSGSDEDLTAALKREGYLTVEYAGVEVDDEGDDVTVFDVVHKDEEDADPEFQHTLKIKAIK